MVGGVGDAPLQALYDARRLGYWGEAVTVVVPGVSDDVGELRQMASTDPRRANSSMLPTGGKSA